jgi:3-deoxy-D-manno-octulosonic-acid transferase
LTTNNPLLLTYRGLSTFAGLVGWPWFYWHLKSRGQAESFRPRLGLDLPSVPPEGYPRIWLHGVSVGEILAAAPLARELRNLLPDAALIVSTGTETGQAVARQHLAPLRARLCYFPLDIPWVVHRYLERLQPQLVVTLESEIWPNFLSLAQEQGVLLALANARISDKSFRRYLRYRLFSIDIINKYDMVAAGADEDYDRLLKMGIPAEKLHLSGNLKFDRLFQDRNESRAREFQRLLHGGADLPPDKTPVFVAGSTHPGEEEMVLSAFEQLRGPYPSLLLVLAPRHPERAAVLGALLARRALPYHLWSRLKTGQESRRHPVVLIDTIGDLFSLYGAADLALVGGSLVPHGGQNILEPAIWGLAPIYGTYLGNFRWAEQILTKAGAGIQVNDAASLAAAALALLQDPERHRILGALAQAALTPHLGAARRQAELIADLWFQKGRRQNQR